MAIVSDEKNISRDDRKRHRIWNEFYNKLDMPHMCIARVWHEGVGFRSGLFLLRTPRGGPIRGDERKIFAAATRTIAIRDFNVTKKNDSRSEAQLQ